MLTAEGKRALLRETASAHGLKLFVETGTYDGETVAAMLVNPCPFYSLHSVELSIDYYRKACERIGPDFRVRLSNRDSAEWLESLCASRLLEYPTLFWLDSHPGEPGTAGTYGECPLRDELKAIFSRPLFHDNVVLIDDVRLFCEPGWPSLDEVREIAKGWNVVVQDDIARITR